MKNKLILAGFVLLSITIGVFAFLYFTEKSARLSAEDKYAEEKKEALRNQADILHVEFETITNDLQSEIHYLSNLEQEIRYVPYEKAIYIDRSLDDAIIIHTNRKANKRATE
jgi:hypothetical protein